jgi:predicted phosphoribosyltransferase
LVYLHAPWDFDAVGEFYDNFRQIDDEEVADLLRKRFAKTDARSLVELEK